MTPTLLCTLAVFECQEEEEWGLFAAGKGVACGSDYTLYSSYFRDPLSEHPVLTIHWCVISLWKYI